MWQKVSPVSYPKSKSIAPFTQPVPGGNLKPLFHFAVLYKGYDWRKEGQSCLTFKQAVEVVIALNPVCVKESASKTRPWTGQA